MNQAWLFEEINKIDNTYCQSHQEKKRKDPNKQNKKWKWRTNNQYHRDTKNRKRILQTVICQQIKQPRRNRQISRNMQPSKTKLGRNRQFEHTVH